MREPSALKAIILGKEYDVQLRTTLMDVLRELGGVVSDGWYGVGGSQEVERVEVAIAGQTLAVEAETYIGLSIAGQTELVRRVARWVRIKQKSPELPIGELDDLLGQLDALKKSDEGPFPYKGCRWLGDTGRYRNHDLVPDLDMFLGDVAGYRSWGRKILDWPDEKIAIAEERLGRSFFQQCPAHAELAAQLEWFEVSDLRAALQNADETRAVLLRLLSLIRSLRSQPNL